MNSRDDKFQEINREISLSKAIKITQESFQIFPTEEIILQNNLLIKKILRKDVYSKRNIPFFTRSAMDGYAVRSEDTIHASPNDPTKLRVIDEVYIGHHPQIRVEECTAIKIPTGGVMPSDANAVIKVEDTRKSISSEIEIIKPIQATKNVSKVGEDIKKDKLLFEAGHRFRSFDKGFLLSAGIKKVVVSKTPSVAILSTGDELIEPWSPKIDIGQVPDVNSMNLFDLSDTEGWSPHIIGIIPDKRERLKESILNSLLIHDIIIISGGTSVGTRDYIPSIISELGEILFHGVSIRPGRPISTAKIQNKPVFGLPGYPVAAIVTFQFIVKPVILSLMGLNKTHLKPTMKGILSMDVKSKLNRLDFLRVRIRRDSNNIIKVIPISISGSGVLTTVVEADGIVIIPESIKSLQKDTEVEVFLI